MANTKGIDETINCPEGFYFGDPCYALNDALYQLWLDWGKENERKTGRYDNDGKFVNNGTDIIVVDSTAYGDGCYSGRQMSYGVDAGCLAVIPLQFCDEQKDFRELGWVVNGSHKIRMITDGDDGSFSIYVDDIKQEYVETGDSTEEEEEESLWDDSLNDNPELDEY